MMNCQKALEKEKYTKNKFIFINRFDRDGNATLAAPCPICMSAIRATGIKVIEHT